MRRASLSFMPIFLVVIMPYGGFPVAKASMTESFKLNQSLGQTLVGQAQQGIQSGVMPLDGMGQNASLSEDSVSQENVSKALRDSAMGQYVLEQEKRPDKKHMVLDPQHDPLMKASTEVVQDPLKVLKADATVMREEGGESLEEHLCEDPADPIEISCQQNLAMVVKNPEIETHTVSAQISGQFSFIRDSKEGEKGYAIPWRIRLWNGVGFEITPQGCSCTVSPDLTSVLKDVDPKTIKLDLISCGIYETRQISPDTVEWSRFKNSEVRSKHKNSASSDTLVYKVSLKRKPEIIETWQSGCAALEALSNDEGNSPCDLIEEKCTQGPETRTINGVPVYRPCWQKTRSYLCGSPHRGTCGEYRIRGCSQTQSECISKVGEKCIRWRQTYQCKKTGQARTRTSLKGEGVPWCLDGNCYSPSWDANGDMLTAMSRMAVLSQIQKDMKDLSVFTGKSLQCRRGCLDFQNCCGTERGWGISLRFAACDDEEKLLAQKQKNGLCVFLGTYCSKRFLGACTQKKSTSCCYESRIARIVQVAAHQQLGISWGSAEHPQCRGLTPEELSKVNLEKVDFRELYEEIMARYKAPQIITPQKDTLTTTVKGVSKGEPVTGKEGL